MSVNHLKYVCMLVVSYKGKAMSHCHNNNNKWSVSTHATNLGCFGIWDRKKEGQTVDM